MLKYKAIILLLFLSSCSDNPIENSCADPIGSEDKSLSDESIICFKDDFNNCFQLSYSSSLKEIRSVIISGGEEASILDAGELSCLGEVTAKPLTGFSPAVGLVEHHGYVVKLPDNTYGRLYVDSDESNGINITWQYSF
ncbi:MAG: hypothetical protein WD824_16530 [Cyclobacteriaceae bacterium]